MRVLRRWFHVVGFLAVASSASAHDLWVEPFASGYTLRYGHHPQVSHDGARELAYSPSIVRSVTCLDAAGTSRPTRVGTAAPVEINGNCAVVYVLTSSGYWTKTPAGTKNVKKTEASSPLGSWQSFESVKHIAQWGSAAANPLRTPLEIVPLDDPLALKDGDKLSLRVLADGRPVADAVVTYDGKPRGQTGPDGAMNIRLRHGGLQLIQAAVRVPHAGAEADEVVHTTALTFGLGGSQ